MELFLQFAVLATIISIAALVWLSAKYPDQVLLSAAKEWQTLIGAILGFLDLSVSLFLTQSIRVEAKEREELLTELAYFQTLSLQLPEQRAELEAQAAMLPSNFPIESHECERAIQALKQRELTPSVVEDASPR